MHARVRGEGPIPCDVLVIADMPGYEEAKTGRPFTGRAGRELRRHFNGYRVPRTPDEVYLSNLSKTPAKDVKSMVFTEQDERELWDEIAMVRPKWIVTCGARVTHFFLGDDVTLEMVHGIPHRMATSTVERWIRHDISVLGVVESRKRDGQLPLIFPTYNPAAALHVPALQTIFARDLELFGMALRGKLPPAAVDERPGQYVLADTQPGRVLDWATVAVDTEGWLWNAWGASYSGDPYYAEVVRRGSEGLAWFIDYLQQRQPVTVLHNSLHDIGVLRTLGADLEELGVPIHDTMIQAYLLGLEPQGLKPLAYRHAGMTHDDYSDVVAEPNARIATDWLMALHDRLPDTPEKLTKTAIKKGAIQLVLTEAEVPLARAKKLIAAMLGKEDAKNPLRKRWSDGRAREILTDETFTLSDFESDPPEATLDEIPLAQAVAYSGRDADATIRVFPHLWKQIQAYNLEDVYATDIAVVPMIERMQTVGLGCDLPHFQSLSLMLQVDEEINREDIRRVVGRDLNPNSGDQVAELLFDEMKLHERAPNLKIKRTEGGERFTTNDKVLEAIEDVDTTGIVKLITDGREIKKIKRSYADPMPRLLGRDGRLHPQYRITRTDTGRLSAANPNVLAFPKHSKRGKLVRDGFVAAPGRELGEWDFDQIEMRVFAHDSGDVRMISEFWTGLDKHALTAAMMYNRPVEDVIAEYKGGYGEGEHERFTAKAVNFGVLMGITEIGLLAQFHKAGQLDWIPFDPDVTKFPKQTKRLLTNWYETYPDGLDYIFRKHAEARQHGYVRDMWGRMRWLEGIHAADEWIRLSAERMAQATPTQSGAQGIVKRSMKMLWPILKDMRKQGIWVECLLQIHDALVLEYDAEHRELIDSTVMAVMHSCVDLSVPVTAKAKFGLRLGAL